MFNSRACFCDRPRTTYYCAPSMHWSVCTGIAVPCVFSSGRSSLEHDLFNVLSVFMLFGRP